MAGSEGFDGELLRSLPADRLVALHGELLARPPFMGTRGGGGALPTLDPATLPVSPLARPLLFGTWRDGGAGERLGGWADGTDEVADAIVKTWAALIHGEQLP